MCRKPTTARTRFTAARRQQSHRAFHSVGRPHAAGGLLTLVKHSLLENATITTETIQDGRILAVMIEPHASRSSMAIVNLYNHDVSDAAIRKLSVRLREWEAHAQGIAAFVLGDLNIPEDGMSGLTTSRRGTSRPTITGQERRR